MQITLNEAGLMQAGQTIFTVWGHRRGDRIEAYVREQVLTGEPKRVWTTHKFKRPRFLLNRSLCGRYFTERHEAQAFCDEVIQGKHVDAEDEMVRHDHCIDRLDEMFGIDRGLGGVSEEDDYAEAWD